MKTNGSRQEALPCEQVHRTFPRGAGSRAAKCPLRGRLGWGTAARAGTEGRLATPHDLAPVRSHWVARLSQAGLGHTIRDAERGGGTLTYGRAVQEKGHAEEHAHAEGEDERPPPAPAQGAPITGGADEGREDEAEDGAQEPGEAVVLLREACDRHAAVRHARPRPPARAVPGRGLLGARCPAGQRRVRLTFLLARLGNLGSTEALVPSTDEDLELREVGRPTPGHTVKTGEPGTRTQGSLILRPTHHQPPRWRPPCAPHTHSWETEKRARNEPRTPSARAPHRRWREPAAASATQPTPTPPVIRVTC